MTNNIKKRGFGSMDKDRLREESRKGGMSVPAEKRAFSKDRELAKRASEKSLTIRKGSVG